MWVVLRVSICKCCNNEPCDHMLIDYFSCPPGGSHYLLLDDISRNLHRHGHDVRMLLQLGNPVITGKLCFLCTR